MIAILVDSRRIGASGWANVRGPSEVRLSGLKEGDEIILDCEVPIDGTDSFVHTLFFNENQITKIPNNAIRVRAVHSKVSDDPTGVHVDLFSIGA